MSQDTAPAPMSTLQDERVLPLAIRQHLGLQLRALYGSSEEWQASASLQALLGRLDVALVARREALTAEVRDGLTVQMPGLLRFALSLTKDPVRADDLVQETLLSAWRSRHTYQPDTNLAGWLTMILRNAFYTGHRRRWREIEDPDEAYALSLSVTPTQEDGLHLHDTQAALAKLSPKLREVLVLVVLNDLSYEEAAARLNCSIGTIKSRIFRAREQLALALGYPSRAAQLESE